MGLFPMRLADDLKLLSRGEIIEVEYAGMPGELNYNFSIYSLEYQNVPKRKFVFWMDRETGKLCCKWFAFIDMKTEADLIEPYELYDVDALSELYGFECVVYNGTFKKKIRKDEVPIDESIMACGLAYLVNVLKDVSQKFAGKFKFYVNDVELAICDYSTMSFEEYKSSIDASNLDINAIYSELEEVACNYLHIRIPLKGETASDEELFGEHYYDIYNRPGENLVDRNPRNKR